MFFLDNFFQHPQKVCLTYYNHFMFSIRISFKLFTASLKAFVHSIYPDIFITSTTDTLTNLSEDLKSVGCNRDELI